ncbi:reversion-inducing cysteine-rich protein with Kazal motifs-like [Homalodisca vitripennis]|uniref:reversion-inducing cysteine-rich protein with Kazal motifs-like n=2 Tax=Homalodisca vitripennis TaxID=197043 RepID=UPI001EEA8DF9|nr:reversion-inducing cysteine-rich protein with Kazal motifs-like [Homalodisca vitripennis]
MTRVFALRTFLWIFVCVDSISGQESRCCTKVTGSCRYACEKLSLASAASDSEYREQRLLDVHNFCSHLLVSFWQCINQTLDEISKGEGWSGRACCGLPQSERCQQACITASGRKDLAHSCRQSDELAFFTCLDKQQMGDECCATAKSDDCKVACRTIFRSELAPNRNAKTALLHACSEGSPRTLSCVNNFTRSAPVPNPVKFLHCCDQATNAECHDTCRRILQESSTDQEIIDSLQEGGCGPPLLHEKIWQCFLQGGETAQSVESSLIDRMGMDSAKLHCCSNARTANCRKLCLKTFSNEWTESWEEFSVQCLSQFSEDSLLHCIDEVEEPCELGCDGLSYCTNFNNRPTELFRSCSVQADDAARNDVALWTSKGVLTLPGLQIPIRNISHCSPLTWKAVACTLQIKPCHRTSHTNRICRQDCFNLLSQCMDWTRMPADTSAASICSRLSPDNPNTPCVSLEPYLEPSDQPYSPPSDQVTQPCKGDPCNIGQVCAVNRYCQPLRSCQPYSCSDGCKLGEVSQHIVPVGSYVRIPISSGNRGCLKICQCLDGGSRDLDNHLKIENCQPMPCFPLEDCWIGSNRQEHGSSFYIECNFCSCYAGEMTCTKKQCDMGLRDVAFTSLPCNCPPHHVPVCGRNGRTYPSACLAKCSGLNDSDFEFGSCEEKDPCTGNPCDEGEACIPAKRVCLSLLHSPCPQHQCVNVRDACNTQESNPVCDTDGHQHPNTCYLVRYGKTLAYHGPCLSGCRRTGVVCGIDGNTYSSECAAVARNVLVDYPGPCLAVGLIDTQAKQQCSSPVICPPLASPGCLGVTPPGACCPVCAGAIRVLYSQKQVDRALYALKSTQAIRALTLQAVLRALDRHVTVAECTVRGHLTVELDILVLVVPVRPAPSLLQLQACVSEAEKLSNLVRLASPKLVSELSVGTLTAARVVHNVVVSGGKALWPTPSLALTPALFLLLRCWS